jgi:hypothetical protein
MLVSLHAIWGSASAPTAQHPRRRPRTAGDRAGQQNRRFIGALAERFGHFCDLFLPSSPCMTERLSPSLGHAIVHAKQRRTSSSSVQG